MRVSAIVRKAIIGSLALVLFAVPWVQADEQLAEVVNEGNQLVFHPIVEFAQMRLTVTGPCGFEYTQVVTKGELIFKLGETTIDGMYRYDLVRIEEINPDVIEVLLQARAKNDLEVPKTLCREGKLPGPPLSQAAGFRVLEQRIVYYPEDVEKSAGSISDFDAGSTTSGELKPGSRIASPKDFVINDDLIVDGSACIGFDCVNGESFGFDTIRVKENNLRIKFDDTSTAASFPRNDWQLTANDSANGGASKFSIDDISGSRTPFTVEANARSHSLYVDDGGRIGSRTSTPSVELHTIDGDTPTLRLQQDGSSGFAPQTWDVAGNETNFFIRDVTNGSQLPFRIRPDAPTSSIFIDVDGDVGLGTSSPDGVFHVYRSGTVTPIFQSSNNGAVQFRIKSDSTNRRIVALDGSDNQESQINFGDDGSFDFWGPTASDTRMSIASNGNVTIEGTLVTGGGGTCDPGPCDAVFTDYELESIEEHATYMWENKHLWGVGPTLEGAPINISKKTTGILHELEKAHIYIEQLNTTVKSQQTLIEELTRRLEALENK